MKCLNFIIFYFVIIIKISGKVVFQVHNVTVYTDKNFLITNVTLFREKEFDITMAMTHNIFKDINPVWVLPIIKFFDSSLKY